MCITPEKEMVCTDGHRLHKADMAFSDDVQPGLYRLVSKTRKLVVLELSDEPVSSYPDYKRVIPEIPAGTDADAVHLTGCKVEKAYTATVRRMADNFTLNYKYFTEAISETDEVFITRKDHGGPVVFRGVETLAVVMPMRM